MLVTAKSLDWLSQQTPNDPTADFPFWKRFAVKADGARKTTFTSLFGANIFLYSHPDIPIGLVGHRNAEMGDRGLAHLQSRDDERETRPLLVIEGMAHLKGWAPLLEEHGFQRVL